MESKAFLTSRKRLYNLIVHYPYFLSKELHICINADRVECLGLNPDWNLDSNELLER